MTEQHSENVGYRRNNWLVEYLPSLLKLNARHIVEFNCSIGKFLCTAAPVVKRITACGWVETAPLGSL